MKLSIAAVGTAVPETIIPQSDTLRMARALACPTAEQETWLPATYAGTRIDFRHTSLGSTWDKFRASMRAIRKAGVSITHDEVDKGFTGIAAPIFGRGGEIEASLSLVFRSSAIRKEDSGSLTELVKRSTRMITAAIR